ncbi:MAG TPA: 2-oxoacid:acceptor oxidoreductase family protein [Acidimicrobiia bacterium]|nr:2-oxoacid:acceptor oxidoreductase family protein [Acidimicrobiia bacterium]
MTELTRVRLAGTGGQGVALAGRVLAAAALISGHHVACSQLFGPESRGGSSHADVILSPAEVGFPVPEALDVLVALSRQGWSGNLLALAQDALVIVDERAATTNQGDALCFPIAQVAKQVTGNPLIAGVVALGTLEALTGMVGADPLRQALASMVPGRYHQANLRALAAGMELAL